ncbi:hypothetical protein AB0G74_19085 [Streptomyces sp. NPDC020875]|uniref:nSTAND1 domain-containing NTPase n=1 Tax=Streptomyces sp. NPDC020875 TaxID=3154898 RepID=UPI00340DB173
MSGAERPERVAELAAVLRRDGPADAVARLLRLRDADRLLLVVDQFEEVLGLPPDAVGECADLLTGDALPDTVRVLTTLRADFLEQVLAHPRFGPETAGRLHTLAPPAPDRLREIVTRPVDALPGISYQPHLADRILADTGRGPGRLPLLALTLDLLWQRQEHGLLTHRAYEEIGGVTGAVGDHAERAWARCVTSEGPETPDESETPENAESPENPENPENPGTPDNEETARRLLTRLVRIPPGGSAPTRRTLSRTELDAGERRIARLLAGTRLLVTDVDAEGTETVELAHEALIGAWDRLAGWITADRAFLEWRASLQRDMDRWEEAGRAPQMLPTALQTARAGQWVAERPGELTEAERHYLAAGHDHRRARLRRRRALLSAGGLVVLLILVALSMFHATREESRDRAAEAASRALAIAAEDETGAEPALGVLKALAAHRTAPTLEARHALLRQYLRHQGYDRVLSGVLGTVRDVAAARDGQVVLATSRLGRAVLYTGAASGRVRSVQVPSTGQVLEVAVAPDGKRVAYVQEDGRAAWFEVRTGSGEPLGPIRRLPDAPGRDTSWGPVVAPALSADGRTLAARVRGRLVWWNLDRGTLAGTVPAPAEMTGALRFGPGDGTLLATVYATGGSQALLSVDPGTGRATPLVSGAQEIFVSGDGGTAVVCRERGGQSVISRHRTSDGTAVGRPYRERDEAYTTDMCTIDAVDTTGRRAALGWGDELRVLDLDRGGTISRAPTPGTLATRLDPHPVLAESHGRLSYLGWNDSMIAFMEMTPGSRLPKAAQHRLTPDGKKSLLVLADGSGTELRPAEPGRSRPVLARAERAKPYWIPQGTDLPVFDPAGALVADREARNTVVVRDASTLRALASVTTAPPPKTRPGNRRWRNLEVSGALSHREQKEEFRYFFDHTGRLLTVSGTVVQQWDPRTGRPTARFDAAALRPRTDRDAVLTIAPYPDRNRISVIVRGRPGIRVVDITDGRTTENIPTPGDVLSASFDPGGRYFAVLRRDVGLEVLRYGDPPRRTIGPLPAFGDSAITPYRAVFLDGGRFLTASDSAVCVFRIGGRGYDDSYPLGRPDGGTGEYFFPDVSRDGRAVIVTTFEEPGAVLPLDPRVWSRELCRIIGHRALTADERDDLPAEARTGGLCP